jgi:hypothetical protein
VSAEDLRAILQAGVSGRIRRRRGGTVSIELDEFEARLLARLVVELLELLDERDGSAAPFSDPGATADPLESLVGEGGPTVPPADPALARLLPDGYRDDPEAAAEFRRFTERELREGKLANARLLLDTLDQVLDRPTAPAGGGPDTPATLVLDDRQAHAWLYALNDLRLALGARLGVEEDYERQVDVLDEEDPRRPVFGIYEWLTGVQDGLVRALR